MRWCEGEKVEGAVALRKSSLRVMAATVGLLGFAACASSSSTDTPRALTEWDFVADPTLRLASDQVGVTFLEPSDATSVDALDSSLPGTDVIPIHVDEAATWTYALDPEDVSGTVGGVELRKQDGTLQFRIIRGPIQEATVTLEPGDYRLFLFSGHSLAQGGDRSPAVFVRPESLAATAPGSTGSRTPMANSTQFKRFIATNVCIRCDLSRAMLAGFPLRSALLQEADLSFARLDGANLMDATLTRARLVGADLTKASLGNAILLGADLTRARLVEAYLGGARMAGATLEGADLSGAIWTDLRVCAQGSIGECK